MKKLLLLITTLCVAQVLVAQITIKGIITDNTGEPLIGATMLIQGFDGMGVATEFDGTFSIDVPHIPITLVASYIGFADEMILLTDSENLEIILGESFGCKSTEAYCGLCCMGPSRDLKIGPSYDFINQSFGVTARLQLPYLLKSNPKLYVDGNWNFTNDINNLNLRIERYDMPRFGRIGTSLIGKYRRVNASEIIDVDLKIIGPQFYYKGFELMVGYASQKTYNINYNLSGSKNINDDSSIDKTDGVHVELSKTVFRVFFQSEITHGKGINQHETTAQYYIPGTQINVKASWSNINGYESGVLGIMYRLGL